VRLREISTGRMVGLNIRGNYYKGSEDRLLVNSRLSLSEDRKRGRYLGSGSSTTLRLRGMAVGN
jgi:hypothetical protein